MNESRRVISTETAPAAIGPYSQAIVTGKLVFTSGQIPVDPATRSVVSGGIQEQAHQVMRNLAAVLDASGSSLAGVMRTTCFLQDLNDFAAFNDVYASYFENDPPARSTIQAAKLPLDVLVEVDCIALVD